MEEKKYWFVNAMVIIVKPLVGQSGNQIINAIVQKHPLIWQQEQKNPIMIHFFTEVSTEIAEKYIQMSKEKSNIVQMPAMPNLKQ